MGDIRDLPSLNESKWKPLAIYFKNVSMDDLRNKTPDQLARLADPEHRFLMLAYAENYLEALLSSDNPYSNASLGLSPVMPKEKPQIRLSCDGKVSLRGLLISSHFGTLDSTLTSVSLLQESMAIDPNKILHLDLSANNLLDEDLQFLVPLICKSPNIKTVNLSENRFHGTLPEQRERVDRNLKMILQHVQEYVDISKNPLATIDRSDFFESLDQSFFAKLIFIPKIWLHGDSWKSLVRASYYDLVVRTHNSYYNQTTQAI